MSTILTFAPKPRFTVPSARLLVEMIGWLQRVKERVKTDDIEIQIADDLRSAAIQLNGLHSECFMKIGIGDATALLVEEICIDFRPRAQRDADHFFEAFEDAQAYVASCLRGYATGFDIA